MVSGGEVKRDRRDKAGMKAKQTRRRLTPVLTKTEKAARAKKYKEDCMTLKVKLHKTKCICPTCGEPHEKKTYHVGAEPARVFCILCSIQAEDDYSDGKSMGY
jgi:transposase-like protein